MTSPVRAGAGTVSVATTPAAVAMPDTVPVAKEASLVVTVPMPRVSNELSTNGNSLHEDGSHSGASSRL